ncbi:hypothetical protein HPB47_021522 [Ixodes persulcatus]|uniref:Uncharacterized protein n=1 Tax=Ixodes persulcatus TaxID=34615 RepID=A0AC60QCL3_IXOPE|nr:hypothetical protein HPB47_021522 [Ixodes persulcatus]
MAGEKRSFRRAGAGDGRRHKGAPTERASGNPSLSLLLRCDLSRALTLNSRFPSSLRLVGRQAGHERGCIWYSIAELPQLGRQVAGDSGRAVIKILFVPPLLLSNEKNPAMLLLMLVCQAAGNRFDAGLAAVLVASSQSGARCLRLAPCAGQRRASGPSRRRISDALSSSFEGTRPPHRLGSTVTASAERVAHQRS